MMRQVLVTVLLITVVSGKLIYLAQLFRHGARYPVTDAFDGKETKPFHGQLTNIGLRQQYLLGSYLRNQYIEKINFLNSTLNHHQIQVYADMGSVERCIYSAISHLHGLYPFGSGYKIPDGIDSQYLEPPFQSFLSQNLKSEQQISEFALDLGMTPTPIYDSNPFFPNCPLQAVLIAERVQNITQILTQFQVEQAKFTEKMRSIFNMPIDKANLAGLVEMYDVITCDKNLGRKLPSNFTDEDYKHLKFIHGFLFQLLYEGELGKIFSTPFIGSVLTKLDESIDRIEKNKTQNMRKMSIFSRHDTDIVPVLAFLNLSSHTCVRAIYHNETVKGNCAKQPDFAANIIFQLHDSIEASDIIEISSNTYYIKIRYNGQYLSPCNDDQKSCQYSKFKAITKAKFVDFKKSCGIKEKIEIKENLKKLHLFS